MIITPPGMQALAYMCPACGNYFYESAVQSYSNFGAVYFSDGVCLGGYTPSWLTRCPRCKQYFAKKHLFKLPKPVMPREIHSWRDKSPGYDLKEQYGDIDYIYSDKKDVDLWEEVICQGIYFPITVREWDKKEYEALAYIALWRSYNHSEEKNDERYIEVCKKITELLWVRNDEQKLILAEVYRNIGEFEESLKYLDSVSDIDSYRDTINCIRNQIEKKNIKTARVERGTQK